MNFQERRYKSSYMLTAAFPVFFLEAPLALLRRRLADCPCSMRVTLITCALLVGTAQTLFAQRMPMQPNQEAVCLGKGKVVAVSI
jgi:hypothetical protein